MKGTLNAGTVEIRGLADSGSAYFRNLTIARLQVGGGSFLFLGIGAEVVAITILLLLRKRRGWLGSGPMARPHQKGQKIKFSIIPNGPCPPHRTSMTLLPGRPR